MLAALHLGLAAAAADLERTALIDLALATNVSGWARHRVKGVAPALTRRPPRHTHPPFRGGCARSGLAHAVHVRPGIVSHAGAPPRLALQRVRVCVAAGGLRRGAAGEVPLARLHQPARHAARLPGRAAAPRGPRPRGQLSLRHCPELSKPAAEASAFGPPARPASTRSAQRLRPAPRPQIRPHIRLQPLSHAVAASITYGCRSRASSAASRHLCSWGSAAATG